jgi:hypothetical protein
MKQVGSRGRSHLDGLALGAFLATIVWLIVHMLFEFGLSDENRLDFIGTIVVAGFSLGAALIALRGVRSQIATTQQIELERRERALFASKAIFAAELAPLFEVAINNIRLHFENVALAVGDPLPPPAGLKIMPPGITGIFKQVIENADPISQDRLANILKHCQVYQARDGMSRHHVIKAFNERMTLDTHNAMSSAIGWAVIHAMISDAIRYARGVDDSVASSVSEKDIRSAFTQSEVFLEAYPTLDKIIQTRAVNRAGFAGG